MDPFDEFEFKPLTDGLGFHGKAQTLKEQVQSSGLSDDHLTSLPSSPSRSSGSNGPKKPMTFDDVISSLEKTPLKTSMPGKTFLEFTEPLPRPKEKQQATDVEIPRPVQSPFPSQDIFRQPSPAFKTQIQKSGGIGVNVGTRRGAADSPHGRLIPTPTSVPAALLDFVVIFALSLIFLAALLTTTKVDLGIVMRGAETEGLTRLSLILVFLAISQMYLVISRSFYGRTLGEWTFDLQLGKSDEHEEPMYPVKVLARSAATAVTGVVILPVLSLILGRDLAGQISGIQLYQQV